MYLRLMAALVAPLALMSSQKYDTHPEEVLTLCETIYAEPRMVKSGNELDDALKRARLLLDRYIEGEYVGRRNGMAWHVPGGCHSDLRAALQTLGGIHPLTRRQMLLEYADKAKAKGRTKEAEHLRMLATGELHV